MSLRARSLSHDRAVPATAAVVVAMLGVVAAFVPAPAHAGNRFTYLIGARAAGMGGAFTALADDGAAAFYNPAGLALHDRHSFDLSASAYGLEIYRVERLIETRCQGGSDSADLNATTLNIVPTSLSMVYRLSAPGAARRHVLAFSVFVPEQRTFNETYEATPCGLRQKFAIESAASRYLIGPSYGVNLLDVLNFGVGLFVVYDRFASSSMFYIHRDQAYPDGRAGDWYYFLNPRREGTGLGLVANAALQVHAGGFRAGLNLRSPILRLYGSESGQDIGAAGIPQGLPGGPATDFIDDRPERKSWGVSQAAPFSMSVGLGYELPGVFRVGLDGHWHAAMGASGGSGPLRHTVNVAVGAEVYITPTLPLAFGFFTDFHPARELADFASANLDYYGVTLALTLLTPYTVADSDRTDRITFATTLGVHYAFGHGEIVGFTFDYDQDQVANARRPMTAHDIHVVVGSSVRF